MQYTLPYSTVQSQDLVGKLAIVTGASRGIGRGIAFNLASRGANVLGTCATDASLANITSLKTEIDHLYAESNISSVPEITGVVAPLTKPQEYSENILNGVRSLGGKLSILVQNAAIQEVMPIDIIDQGHVTRLLTGNVEAPILLMKTLLPYFQPDSRIISISSEVGRDSQLVTLVYSACKSALESMTRTWADFLGSYPGVERTTVNSIVVGLTRTDTLAKAPDSIEFQQFLEAKMTKCSVEKRVGNVDDIAQVAGWLASEHSRWVTGSAICATGGAVKIL